MTVVAALVAAAIPASGAATNGNGGISFADGGRQLVVTASAYRLTLDKKNGKIVDLVDRSTGTHLLQQTTRCLWGAISYRDISYIGGCSFASHGGFCLGNQALVVRRQVLELGVGLLREAGKRKLLSRRQVQKRDVVARRAKAAAQAGAHGRKSSSWMRSAVRLRINQTSFTRSTTPSYPR